LKEAAVNEGRSGRGGFPLIEEGEDIGGGQGAGGLEFAVFLAEEEFAGGIEDGDSGDTAIKGHIVLFSEIEVFVAMTDIHVNDCEICLEGRSDFGAVEGFVKGVAIAAPIGAEDDKNTFVRGRGGMERFADFLLGVGVGGIEIFLRVSLRQSRGAGGRCERLGEWMKEEQEKCKWKGVHRNPVSCTRIGGVNERNAGIAEEEGKSVAIC
jgi:hypothetical protein